MRIRLVPMRVIEWALVLLALLMYARPGLVVAVAPYESDPSAAASRAEVRAASSAREHLAKPSRSSGRENYRKTASLFLSDIVRLENDWARRSEPYPNIRAQVENLRWLAFAYNLTREEGYAIRAVRILGSAYRLVVGPPTDLAKPGFHELAQLCLIEKWLAPSSSYVAIHRDQLRAIALSAAPRFPQGAVEYGSFNRAFQAALAAESLLLLVPDAPDAAKWKEYKERIWADWWAYRDTNENSDHYNALWFGYLLDWVELRGVGSVFWSDAGVKDLFSRYLYQVFPMGVIPHFSDSVGWNVAWGYWVRVFEACATNYKDGRYKWAARRIYEYSVDRIENIKGWSYTGSEAAWNLLRAYSVADDSIKEVARDSGVRLLKRHRVVQRSLEHRNSTGQFFDIFPDLVPDKLVFYGGIERDDLSMTIDAFGAAGHGHRMPSALVALADHQSVLLMSLGYLERLPEHHNIPQLIDYEGYLYNNTSFDLKSDVSQVIEASADDLGNAGYARIEVENYLGYPATLVREVVFVKDVGVLLKDTVTSRVGLYVRWGPAYRVRNVGPDHGDHWINTYMGDWIPVRGMQSDSDVLVRWRNDARDLLIYFVPDQEGKLELVDDTVRDKTLPLPQRIQYAMRKHLKANEPVSVVTLLLPHKPGPAAELAGKIRVITNQVDRTLIEFSGESGVSNRVMLDSSRRNAEVIASNPG